MRPLLFQNIPCKSMMTEKVVISFSIYFTLTNSEKEVVSQEESAVS